MSPKPPAARGFTRSEKNALRFEGVTLYMVGLVAVIAATISFIALKAVGADAGLGGASWLLPIAIDGFGIACSVGIVRSVAVREPFRERISEWFGLFAALGLSILGNVHHALLVGAPTLPDYVKIAYAFAVPCIVAYGIHVYGRAMSKGISAHVLADDPTKVHFDLAQINEGATANAPAAPARKTTTAPRQVTASTAPRPSTSSSASTAPRQEETAPRRSKADSSPAMIEARRMYDEMVDASPVKPNAGTIHDAVAHLEGAYAKPQNTRDKVRKWWLEDARNPDNQSALSAPAAELRAADPAPADPIATQVDPKDDSRPMRAVV